MSKLILKFPLMTVYLIVVILFGILFFLISQYAYAGPSIPVIENVRIADYPDGPHIDPLEPEASKDVDYYITGIISNPSGWQDIDMSKLRAVLFKDTEPQTCQTNYNNCYRSEPCQLIGSGGIQLKYSCRISLQYYADATVTPLPNRWWVWVEARTFLGVTGEDFISTNVSSLVSAYSSSSLDFGTMQYGETATTDSITITNFGNRDVQVSTWMTNPMTCTTGTIPIESFRFDAWTNPWVALNYQLSPTAQAIPVALNQQIYSATPVLSTIDTYWSIMLPASGFIGNCVGTIGFMAQAI